MKNLIHIVLDLAVGFSLTILCLGALGLHAVTEK